MMKAIRVFVIITCLVLFVILLSCGSRKAATNSNSTQEEGSIPTSQTTSEISREMDVSKLREALQGFEVKGSGTGYKLRYKGFVFEGNGDVKFNNSQKTSDNKKVVEKEVKTRYITHTTYKTVTKFKSKKSESKRPSFWLFALVGVVSIVLWGVMKKYWYKIINR